jgi:hypothetical protein
MAIQDIPDILEWVQERTREHQRVLDVLEAYWFVLMDAEVREEERLCIPSDLEGLTRRLGIPVILPDDDDPLESIDLTPERDLDYPSMSSEEYGEELHFDDFND